MGLFKQLFFLAQAPTEAQLESGRRYLIAEGAVAAVIYSIGTGNFLAGYLSCLGASISFCALVAMIPQLGCVLQFLSPFVFERIHHRKLAIWLMCVVYRCSLGIVLLVPLVVPGAQHARAVVLVLYTISFFSAGLVTPGLQHMTLGLAPEGSRGQFFARKDIVAACVNSAATLLLGRQLDYFTAAGKTYTGFLVIGGVCCALAIADAVMLALVHENPVKFVSRMRPTDILRPVKDPVFRPLLLYSVVGGLASGLSAPFLSVYQLRVLNLSHTFITSVGVVSAVVGMAGSWCWGRCADATGWRRVILLTACFNLSCTLGWAFIRPAWAPFTAPVLMIVTAACGGGASIASMNLQFASSPESGKTAYIGVTSAMASIAACASAAVGTALQPHLETLLGPGSIPLLFLLAGLGGFANLAVNGRKLPDARS